ncbi:methyltransferase domain-containing protein [bacterium]|nr:methyltransferase domain-containing protein [bacterium]MBU1995250.1 methyltransferase domain-containing protein [bacterium]
MIVSAEFSKYATHYGSRNVIQKKVAQRLLDNVKSKPKNILDLGCGDGAICRSIDWTYENFTAVDFALGMLELHPKSEKIGCIYGDFNERALFENLSASRYDYIFSASALQWATDIETVFKNIKLLNAPVALAIFTSNTFKTLNETALLHSFLSSAEEIYKLQEKYFDAEFELVRYKLEFESTREMFRYIKKSGVSGSRKVLDYKQTKKLMHDYPINYLEFEVAFIHSR